MKCPRDGTALAKVMVGDIELDKCHLCDGIWCDRGELERIRDAQVTGVEEELEARYGNPTVERGETDGYMKCPRCGGRLQGITYTYVRPVKIDRCEACLGFWLDDRELDSITGEKKAIDQAASASGLKSLLRSLVKWAGQ